MNTGQENHLGMYLSKRDYSLQNATITANLPNYPANLTILQNTIPLIQSTAEQQKIDKKGGTSGKKQLAASLISIAADDARKLTAYAKFTNNPTLLGEVHITESEFKNFTDTDLKDYAQIIYDRAQTNIAALTTYGITAVTQTAFLAAINAYNASLSVPRVNTTVKSQATKQLVVLFATADAAIENMDAAVEIIRLSQPNFYNGYKTASKVINTSSGSLAAKGTVKDSITGEGLVGAMVKISPNDKTIILKLANEKGELIKRTSQKGGFNVKSLPEGSYTVTISKPGYKDQIVTMNITNGELTVLHIKLEKA